MDKGNAVEKGKTVDKGNTVTIDIEELKATVFDMICNDVKEGTQDMSVEDTITVANRIIDLICILGGKTNGRR